MPNINDIIVASEMPDDEPKPTPAPNPINNVWYSSSNDNYYTTYSSSYLPQDRVYLITNQNTPYEPIQIRETEANRYGIYSNLYASGMIGTSTMMGALGISSGSLPNSRTEGVKNELSQPKEPSKEQPEGKEYRFLKDSNLNIDDEF